MKCPSVLLAVTCLLSVVHAQTSWWKTYGGAHADGGYAVQQTTDGGFIVVGSTCSVGAGSNDVYLVKTNASGDTLWSRTHGGASEDGFGGSSIQQTTDGGYIIATNTHSVGAGNGDVYLIKTDAQGDTLWTRTYGGTRVDKGYSVRQITEGGYIATGHTYSFGPGTPGGYANVYLIKTDAQGDTLWTRTYGGTGDDGGNCVLQTADSGYVVAGFTNGDDVFLVRTNAHGDTLWTRSYGGTRLDAAGSIQATSDGGYIIAGWTLSLGDGMDVYLIKTNASGDTLWTRTYGGVDGEYGESVQQTADRGYVVAGSTQSFGVGTPDRYNAYLIRTDASGDTLWTGAYGGTSDDCGYSAQQTTDGGYVVTGYNCSFGAGGADVYLIKTDSLGNVGVAEESFNSQVVGRTPAATAIHSLPFGSVAFDAMGRRMVNPRSGIFFVRDEGRGAGDAGRIRKVILQR